MIVDHPELAELWRLVLRAIKDLYAYQHLDATAEGRDKCAPNVNGNATPKSPPTPTTGHSGERNYFAAEVEILSVLRPAAENVYLKANEIEPHVTFGLNHLKHVLAW